MNTPYKITRSMWNEYHRVQKSGRMNMMLHPLVEYFMSHNAWEKAYDHFGINKETEDLVIE